jgi:mutator protein MutT
MVADVRESRPSLSVAVAVCLREGHCLIGRRLDDGVLGGDWEFPGGKAEAGETPVATAVREAAEELAVEVEPIEVLPSLHFEYPHARITLTPVLCRITRGDPQPLAATELRWIPLPDLPRYAFPPANAPLIRLLVTRFSSGCIPPPKSIS